MSSPIFLLFKNAMDTVPNMNRGLAKQEKHSILVDSSSFNEWLWYNSFVYLALAGFPDRRLITNTKAACDFILKNLVISGFNNSPKNSGIPYLIIMLDKTKNGNNEGKILFFHMAKEKLTEFNMLCDSVKIS